MISGIDENEFPMSIGKLSAASGCSRETIRYYEKQELLPRSHRTTGGHRQYDKTQYKLLMFILRARQLGFSQPDVRLLLNMADPSQTRCDVVHEIASQQLNSVQGKIKDLRRLEKTLKELIADCETGIGARECPVIESLLDEPFPDR